MTLSRLVRQVIRRLGLKSAPRGKISRVDGVFPRRTWAHRSWETLSNPTYEETKKSVKGPLGRALYGTWASLTAAIG